MRMSRCVFKTFSISVPGWPTSNLLLTNQIFPPCSTQNQGLHCVLGGSNSSVATNEAKVKMQLKMASILLGMQMPFSKFSCCFSAPKVELRCPPTTISRVLSKFPRHSRSLLKRQVHINLSTCSCCILRKVLKLLLQGPYICKIISIKGASQGFCYNSTVRVFSSLLFYNSLKILLQQCVSMFCCCICYYCDDGIELFKLPKEVIKP